MPSRPPLTHRRTPPTPPPPSAPCWRATCPPHPPPPHRPPPGAWCRARGTPRQTPAAGSGQERTRAGHSEPNGPCPAPRQPPCHPPLAVQPLRLPAGPSLLPQPPFPCNRYFATIYRVCARPYTPPRLPPLPRPPLPRLTCAAALAAWLPCRCGWGRRGSSASGSQGGMGSCSAMAWGRRQDGRGSRFVRKIGRPGMCLCTDGESGGRSAAGPPPPPHLQRRVVSLHDGVADVADVERLPLGPPLQV